MIIVRMIELKSIILRIEKTITIFKLYERLLEPYGV